MTIEEIKELIKVVNESGVAELEVQRGDNRVRIRRSVGVMQDYIVPAAAHAPIMAPGGAAANPGHGAAVAHAPAPGAEERPGASPALETIEEGHELVKSPIVGTYYDAPSPDAPPFVRVGDTVEPGQVLCIIESMKLMNEIESEIAGTIVAKLVENGRPVEYGEAMFAIRPR
jgi:acetyl-CoA carboxylase biotin carboxyl carrier protein